MPLTLTERFSRYAAALKKKPREIEDEQKIVINEAVGAIAFYYEKIRSVIDYADEHLLRQNAIRRILSRRLILQDEPEKIANGLVRELVRSRYFPNNTLGHRAISEVAEILAFYLRIVESLRREKTLSDKDSDWLIAMAACAIDERLSPMDHEEALVRLMYEQCEPLTPQAQDEADERLRKSQMFIAAYRILLRPDIHRLRYFILKQSFPEWIDTSTDPRTRATEYANVARKIDALIRHPLNKKFQGEFRRHRIPFIVLLTIAKNNPEAIMDPDVLEREATRICEGLYSVQHRRLYSRTIRAFVYIFLTKMVLGLAVELPYDLLTAGEIHGVPLLINILFPPFLLAAIAFTVSFPSDANTRAIVQAVKEILYKETPAEIFVPKKNSDPRRNRVLSVFFTIFYLAVYAISFGAVAWVLHKLNFNLMSGIIFFLFFSLITFFGITLRRQVRELIILKPRQTLLGTLLDTFSMPIVQVGHWLSFNISRVNVFVFLFDVLIELPLQAFIEITEEWFSFIKEKKEEIE